MPVSPLPWRIEKDRDTTCVMDATNNRVMDNEDYYPVHVDVDDMALVVEAVNAYYVNQLAKKAKE